jgi:YegS/Rv2252/BmrU family lipid kinase
LEKRRAILVVVNPGAGKSDYQPKLDRVYHALKHHKYTFSTFFTEKTAPEGKLEAVFKGNPAINEIWVIGGDGTLNYVVNELKDRHFPISIVSGGTGNDSVKSLHGVVDFKQQVDIALNGRIKDFDLGICNDHYFVNGVGIGFDGKVVEKMVQKGYKTGSHLSYLYTVLQLLAGYQEKTIEFSIDNLSFHKKIFLMTISNGTTFGGGFILNPSAVPDDGMLDVCIFNKISVPKRFFALPKLRTGSHTSVKETEFHRASEILVSAHDQVVAHMDGEFIGHPPFRISMSDKKMHVRTPV